MKSGDRLFLIDGSSFCYRAFYAIRSLSTSRGQPTNAVYGVVAMLRKLLEEEKPECLAVAFDLPKPTFRHLRYEAYKEHRKPMPEPLVEQLPWIREVLKGFRIPLFEREGYEADDILGTLAVQAVKRGMSVYLVTGDKDALQLVGGKVKVYRPVRDGHEILDDRTLKERWHLRPDQVVDVMALMGDESDAIPGVPGIGEKTAVELIQRHGSVETLLDRLGKDRGIRPALVKAIREHEDQLQLSRELATLDTAVPLEIDWEDLKRKEPDMQALRRIYQTLEFRTLVKELSPAETTAPVGMESTDSLEEIREWLPAIRQAGRVAVAVACSEGHAMTAEVLAVAIAWEEGVAKAAPGEKALEDLRPLWEDPKILKICPGLKELLILLYRRGIHPRGPWADPSLASYLLNPARPSHRIEDLALEVLELSVSDPDPIRRAGRRALAACALMPNLEEEIRSKELSVLLNEVEVPLAGVLARMELAGMEVDPGTLEELGRRVAQGLETLTREIERLAGGSFNLNSPKQLSEILFERLKLPIIKRTKTGASTDEEVLRRLSLMHELPAKILEYRELAKLRSTYVEALPRFIHPETQRIHAHFHQTVTATGRLSSSDPNLQNIPIRTELGRQVRRAFVPSAGWEFLAADYSQIELRILAHLAEDEALVEAFRQGQDIHRVTASEVFQVDPGEVSAGHRAVAKTINFGILYGMTAFGLSKELGVEPGQAEEFIRNYFARYPQVRAYLDRSLEEARSRGYALTLFHRRRYLPELRAKELSVRQFAERMAVNAPIQGSAADLIKVAMVALDAALLERRFQSRMVCQVHDELILEVPPGEMEKVQPLVREVMESPTLSGRPIRLKVPIEVNLKSGRNWFEASH